MFPKQRYHFILLAMDVCLLTKQYICLPLWYLQIPFHIIQEIFNNTLKDQLFFKIESIGKNNLTLVSQKDNSHIEFFRIGSNESDSVSSAENAT